MRTLLLLQAVQHLRGVGLIHFAQPAGVQVRRARADDTPRLVEKEIQPDACVLIA